jgi:hypothetical protein
MLKSGIIVCGVLFLSLVNRAYSAPAASPLSPAGSFAPSTFTAPTVGDFLSACRSNPSGCADEIGAALLDKMSSDGTADICLPSTDYTAAVPAWLNSHRETHNMPTEDGIHLSLKTLYPCG